MKHREPIAHIMSKDVHTVHRKQNLLEVLELMEQEKICHVPVLSGEDVIGILSRTDVMRVSYGTSPEEANRHRDFLRQFEVGEVMTAEPVTVSSETAIRNVGEILHKNSFSALPVVDEGKLVGIITTNDLLAYLLEQY